MEIVNKNLDHLVPYARNARTHSDAQISQIAASLVEFGWANPILIHNGSIVAGHGRLAAAKRLRDAGTIIPGWENNREAPTIDLSHLTDTQRKAYILADNRIALSAGWDNEMLALEMGELFEEDFKLELTGFDPSEIANLFGIDLEQEEPGEGESEDRKGNLASKFGIPPFSVMSAREGWWQDRKRAWIDLGIRSELGRGAAPGGAPMPLDRQGGGQPNAAPGGSMMPATNYSKSRARGDGRGRPVNG